MSGGTIAPETPRSSLTLLRLFADHPRAFWRHDVDMSLSAAVRMAEVAQTAGVESTFYVNPRSSFYNVFSREAQEALRRILQCGHWLGLHCDLRAMPGPRTRTAEFAVESDHRILKQALGALATHRPVSFHIPNESVLWRDFGEFDNAYASKWEGRYRSDSRGVLPDLSDVGDGEGWQINLHPEWWDL